MDNNYNYIQVVKDSNWQLIRIIPNIDPNIKQVNLSNNNNEANNSIRLNSTISRSNLSNIDFTDTSNYKRKNQTNFSSNFELNSNNNNVCCLDKKYCPNNVLVGFNNK